MAQRKAGREAAIQAKKPTRRRKPRNPSFKGERTLAQDLLHLRSLKRKATELNAKAKEAGTAKAEFEAYVVERMEYEGAEMHAADHTTFSRVKQIYATVQDKDKFLVWLADQGDEGPDLLKTNEIREGDLNTLVRKLLDDGGQLPPGVGYYIKERVSATAR